MDMTQKLTDLLFECGVCPLPRSKVLAYFIDLHGAETTAREIERKTDLRQPEVSLALSAFQEKKWVTELKSKEQEGKGRPTKTYILAVPTEAIYKSIAAGIEKECTVKTEVLKQLKAAMIPAVQSELQK